MGKSRTAGRKLDPIRVQMAERTQQAKHELAMKMVAERVKVDAEFAADVLKIAGEGLRPEIRKDAEETIARLKANMEHAGGIGNAIGLAVMNNDGKLPTALEVKNALSQGVVLDNSEGHGYELSKVPDDMKAVPVNVPIGVAEVEQAKLRDALTALGEKQAERLKDTGLV